ncbi:ABC transporter substrate-binding protein [Nocardioides insulae]|uniref:ABC transporter substrate-binding protein n=1 Tax=Nocardioides insulae TaxID=394734 RepID=UPI00040D847E|nr:ABC transporter substrate-binding protein [Nocardioides insulae]
MANYRKRALAISAAAALTVALAACGGGSDSDDSSGSTEATEGGTLNYLIDAPIEHLDPQRVYVGRDISNLSRTVYRTLVTFPISDDPDVSNTPVADLATDTGTANEDSTEWSFTVKDGVTWQDGSEITCEDFKYGASRVFAQDVITGGPNYLIAYLDVPTDPKTGASVYKGPYSGEGQEFFDKAVTCDGQTITYHFSKPWPDFPLAISALHMMDPFKESMDKGDKSNFQIFASGPYMLDGEWNKASGGKLVRNPEYDPATDDPENIRRALPDEIVFKLGNTAEVAYDQLIADSGDAQNAVTERRVPPAYYSQVFDSGNPSVEDRVVTVESPYVDYLVPNFKSPTMQNPDVRKALAAATNQDAYIQAGGGEHAYIPADTIVNPAVTGSQPNPAFEGSSSGDVEAAKELLQKSGVQTPVEITYAYQQTDTADKQAAALKATWDEAGFKTTLNPLGDTYYDIIQKPNTDMDVYWAGWGADWPSAITVTPPLFSKVNLSASSNGNNYGAYSSDAFEEQVHAAQTATEIDEQTTALQEGDKILGEDTAYIPLEISIFNFMYGSKVTEFTTTTASNGFPDLGAIGVSN